MIELSIKDRRGNIIKHQLGEGKHSLGKSILTDIILMDYYVSRHHADIIVTKDGVFIVDFNSKNGVWVNGRRIRKCVRLTSSDCVRLGALELSIDHSTFHFAVKQGAEFSDEEIVIASPDENSNVIQMPSKGVGSN